LCEGDGGRIAVDATTKLQDARVICHRRSAIRCCEVPSFRSSGVQGFEVRTSNPKPWNSGTREPRPLCYRIEAAVVVGLPTVTLTDFVAV
jgi:hypothetical protein